MAHIRRHFEQALDENKSAAEFALGEIQKLYHIERTCTEANMSDDERKKKRQELARPIMEHLKAWMETEGVKKCHTLYILTLWKNQNHLNYYHYYHIDGSSCIRKHV